MQQGGLRFEQRPAKVVAVVRFTVMVRDRARPVVAGDPVDVREGTLDEREGSEDCLSLNVSTPTDGSGTSHRPVIVWLHGGGYVYGVGSQYDPTRLVTQ